MRSRSRAAPDDGTRLEEKQESVSLSGPCGSLREFGNQKIDRGVMPILRLTMPGNPSKGLRFTVLFTECAACSSLSCILANQDELLINFGLQKSCAGVYSRRPVTVRFP